MKSSFPGYIRPTKAEFDDLWQHARIVVDANVLLNVYGYSPVTREKLFAIFEVLADRLWMPHQFALEFLRNRPGVILKQVKNVARVTQDLRKILDNDFRSQTTHPFVDDAVVSSMEDLCRQLDTKQSEIEHLIKEDPILNQVLALFDKKVGPPPSNLAELHKQARARYEQQIPPGYSDAKAKPEPDCFADYLGWAQVLEFAKTGSSAVILVSDDSKPDWWRIHDRRTLGPRPELIAEFATCCGAQMYLYSSSSFVQRASDHLNIQLNETVVRELRAATEARIAEQAAAKSAPKASSKPAVATAAPISSSTEEKVQESPKLSMPSDRERVS